MIWLALLVGILLVAVPVKPCGSYALRRVGAVLILIAVTCWIVAIGAWTISKVPMLGIRRAPLFTGSSTPHTSSTSRLPKSS